MTSLVEKLEEAYVDRRNHRVIWAHRWDDIIGHARRQEANLNRIEAALVHLEDRANRLEYILTADQPGDRLLDMEQPQVRIRRVPDGVEIHVGGELRFTIL